MAIDYTLFSFINGFAGVNSYSDWIIIFFAVGVPYILITLTGLLLFLRKQLLLRERVGVFVYALLAATFARFAITGVIWRLYERPRPFLTHEVNQLLFVDAPSFPSGHSTFMFAFSTVIYFYDRNLGTLMFICSVLIVLSRIAASVHYPSDIIGGALIGTSVGFLAVRVFRKWFPRYDSPKGRG